MVSIVELVRLFAEPLETAVVVTNCVLKTPGPTILYVNPAFVRMSEWDADEVIGQTPKLLQGPHTDRHTSYALARKLRTEGRFRGILQNYRKSGEAYLCELDVHRINGSDGITQGYIAFEREVIRRRGRPSKNKMTRYQPIAEIDPILNVFRS